MIDFTQDQEWSTPKTIMFEVEGTPVGQGMHRTNRYTGHIYEASKGHGPWRRKIIKTAQEATGDDWQPILGPVEVFAVFTFPRPKKHYGTGKNATVLKSGAPLAHTVGPDLDHLQRCLGDALEHAEIIGSDAAICAWQASKVYGDVPGVHVMVTKIDGM